MTHSVTRLVVGEPFDMGLGRLVAQRHAGASAPGSLHWRNGGWVPAAADEAAAAIATPAPAVMAAVAAVLAIPAAADVAEPPAATLACNTQPVAQDSVAHPRTMTARRFAKFLPERRAGWTIAALAAMTLGAGFTVVLTGGELGLPWRVAATPAPLAAPAPRPLPIAPAPDEIGAIRIVSAPYTQDVEAPTPALAASGATPLPPLVPLAGAQVVARAASAAPVARPPAPVASNAAASHVTPHTPAKAKEPQGGQPGQPAVVLDEATPVAAPAARPASAAASAAKGPASVSKADTLAAKQPPMPRGTGLVAITPDGKSAVFTNSKTRLPVQYKLGEQLPEGDSIRLIDFKEGKVVTSTKEYSLD